MKNETKDLAKVADAIVSSVSRMQKIALTAMQQLMCENRDIGECIIRHYSPKAKKDKRPFEELTAEERLAMREDAGKISREELGKLGELLVERGVTADACSVTNLYEGIRLAVNYRPSEILTWTKKGITKAHLLTCAALENDDDRKQALKKAVEEDIKADAFTTVVEEVEQQSSHGFTPEAKRARSASATKKKKGGGKRKPKTYLGSPADDAILLDIINNMADYLDTRGLTVFSNMSVKMKEEFPELEEADQDAILRALERMDPLLNTLIESVKWLRELYGEQLKKRKTK